MAEIVLSVDVDAPVADTWAAAVDWDAQGEWMLGTTVRTVSAERTGVGVRLEAFTGAGPVGFLDTMEVTHWDPPHRCLVRHTGRVVRGVGAFEVQERPGGGSRFVMSEWLDLPLGRLGEVGFLLARPPFAAGVQASLHRFAQRAEARAAERSGRLD